MDHHAITLYHFHSVTCTIINKRSRRGKSDLENGQLHPGDSMIVMPVSWLNYRAGEHSLPPAGLRVQGLYGQVKNPRGRGSRGAINEPSCAQTPQRYAQCPFRNGSSTTTFHRVNYSDHPPPMEHPRINFDLDAFCTRRERDPPSCVPSPPRYINSPFQTIPLQILRVRLF